VNPNVLKILGHGVAQRRADQDGASGRTAECTETRGSTGGAQFRTEPRALRRIGMAENPCAIVEPRRNCRACLISNHSLPGQFPLLAP
jgi:hypothetical protein